MGWQLADALEQLRSEVNRRWPNRDKKSDGTVADSKHSTSSDHSPRNPKHPGVVTAIDIDADDGTVAKTVWDHIIETRDFRVKYAIYRGMMVRSYPKPGIPAWTPSRYYGSNGHFTHIHISLKDAESVYNDQSPWGIWSPDGDYATPEEEDVLKRDDRQRKASPEVKVWQKRLNLALGAELVTDGFFGEKTEDAVTYFQNLQGLTPSGVIDLTTAVQIQARAHGKGSHEVA